MPDPHFQVAVALMNRVAQHTGRVGDQPGVAGIFAAGSNGMKRCLSLVRRLLLFTGIAAEAACTPETPRTLITIADARIETAKYIDTGEPGDSPGDILVFDQPLLDEHHRKIGNNSGTCVRTRVGHSYQCQWTLTFKNGSIQVAGREHDQGTSDISIIGGTGKYSGISGDMTSVNNNDGTFTQTLRYYK